MSSYSELPQPYAVANHCAIYAWRQDLPEDVRILFEMAADSLRQQYRERLRYSSRLEQCEAQAERLFHMHYGPQKGGAS